MDESTENDESKIYSEMYKDINELKVDIKDLKKNVYELIKNVEILNKKMDKLVKSPTSASRVNVPRSTISGARSLVYPYLIQHGSKYKKNL